MDNRRSDQVPVTVYDGENLSREKALLVREVPLTLYVNGEELLTLVTTGDANRELAVGFLLSEGFLKDPAELASIREDAKKGVVEVTLAGDTGVARRLWQKRTVTSGCGKGSTFYLVMDSLQTRPVESSLTVSAGQVLALMKKLHEQSALYRETGGVHNSALASAEKILLFRDDIGRHNAVDKIRGATFLGGIDPADKLLVTTGRLTSEIVIKAAKMGVPILASRSAPTTLAVELAERVDLTLVGYVRAGKMKVYAGPQRITP